MGRPLIDIVGQQFGRLTVKAYLGRKHHSSIWRCKCVCGNVVDVQGGALKNGTTKSCGCWQSDRMAGLNLKHGYARNGIRAPEYKTWEGMRDRCRNPRNKSYNRYGGRGIKVCERWQEFHKFIEDMGPKPGGPYSLERIDNDGDYEPANCKWALSAEQGRNKSNNRIVSFNGRKMSLIDASIEANIPYKSLKSRLQKGWDIERALKTPVNQAKVYAQRIDRNACKAP